MSDRAPVRRAAPRAAASRGSAGGGRTRPSAFLRGAAGMSRTDEEIQRGKEKAEQRKQQAGKPFRFYIPSGENREFIICDDAPDFFMYEHALKDSDGKWGRLFTGCIRENDNCPVCAEAERESYYAMFLTIVDLTPFETRDGQEVLFSRKLLCVKPQQQKKFIRMYQQEGTLRGAIIKAFRDGDKDAQIGNDFELLGWADEAEMESYFREWKDQKGVNHEEECGEPFVYEELFEEPTAENLRAIVGGEPPPGSRAANSRELGGSRGGRGAAPARGGREEAPARGRGAAPARGRAPARGEDGWDDAQDSREFGRGRGRGAPADDADDTQDAPPARGRRQAAEPAPAPRGRGRAAPVDDDGQDDAPPARGRGRAAPRDEPDDSAPPPRRAAGRGRAPDPDDVVDDAQEEPAPRRGRAARAEPAEEPEAPRRGRGRQEPVDEPEEAPAPRRGRAAAPAPAPRGRGRAAAHGDDNDPPFD